MEQKFFGRMLAVRCIWLRRNADGEKRAIHKKPTYCLTFLMLVRLALCGASEQDGVHALLPQVSLLKEVRQHFWLLTQ